MLIILGTCRPDREGAALAEWHGRHLRRVSQFHPTRHDVVLSLDQHAACRPSDTVFRTLPRSDTGIDGAMVLQGDTHTPSDLTSPPVVMASDTGYTMYRSLQIFDLICSVCVRTRLDIHKTIKSAWRDPPRPVLFRSRHRFGYDGCFLPVHTRSPLLGRVRVSHDCARSRAYALTCSCTVRGGPRYRGTTTRCTCSDMEQYFIT